jgi:hypothetical protein
MENQVNTGNRAATRQSWQRDRSVRVIVGELQLQNPKAGEKRLLVLARDAALAEPDVLDAFIEYGVHNVLAAQAGYFERKQRSVVAA